MAVSAWAKVGTNPNGKNPYGSAGWQLLWISKLEKCLALHSKHLRDVGPHCVPHRPSILQSHWRVCSYANQFCSKAEGT